MANKSGLWGTMLLTLDHWEWLSPISYVEWVWGDTYRIENIAELESWEWGLHLVMRATYGSRIVYAILRIKL